MRLLGKCLKLLREHSRKSKRTTFKKVLSLSGVKYNPNYARFLIRLSELTDKYPKLLHSSKSLFWFKANLNHVEKICSFSDSEWAELPEQHYVDDEINEMDVNPSCYV